MPNIVKLHEEVFLYLWEKKAKMPDLCFTLQNKDAKLEKGYWFAGSEKNLYFSFWEGSDKISKAFRISITISLDGELFLYLNARDSNDYAKVFNMIARTSGGKFTQYGRVGKQENQWLRRYEGKDWRENLNEFISEDMPIISGLLEISAGSIQDVAVLKKIDQKSFEINYYNRLKRAREIFYRYKEKESQRRQEEEQRRQEEEQKRQEEERKKVKELRLNRVQCNHIGHFDHIELDLSKRVTILIGENGSGKSTILRAIALGITGVSIFQPEGEDFNKYSLTNEYLTKWLTMIDTKDCEPIYASKGSIILDYTVDDQKNKNEIIWEKEKDGINKFADVNNIGDFNTFVERNTKKGLQNHLINLLIGLPQGSGYNPPHYFNKSLFPDAHQLLNLIKDSGTDRLDDLKNWIELYDFRHKEKLLEPVGEGEQAPKETKWSKAIKHLFKIISKITLEEGREDSEVEFLRVCKNETNKTRIVIKKINNPNGIYLDMLSQGYNNLFYWLGDILSTLYRFKDYCEEEPDYERYAALEITDIPAIVLIDEIDTYLHPDWQAKILAVLVDSFPKLRFVVTTHSQLVLSSLENVKVYVISDQKATEIEEDLYGLDSNLILDRMNSYIRSPKVQHLLNEILEHIEDNELDLAESKLAFFAQKPIMADVLKAEFKIRQKRKANEAH
ncbi:MAG: hypothetical protein EAZ97_09185 [Bacteroidetes bacterium]|nr:MAG: hypothetical protein EAZ97_09185 [Bacteroidota bacterium]